MMAVIVGGVLLLLAIAGLYFEIYAYEGYHLGPRIQGWFYDSWAARYDRDKQESQARDADLLARPLLDRLGGPEGAGADLLVLDVATGTGRVPLALLQEPEFRGQIVGLDISQGMLVRAAAKLNGHRDRILWVRHPAAPLPFPDEAFDVVSCVESLMIMRDKMAPLAEFARVLRPGGVLLTSRGRETLGPVGRAPEPEAFVELLGRAGFQQVEVQPWWKLFDRVWARKPGHREPAAPRRLFDVLRCPACGRASLQVVSAGSLVCGHCGEAVPTSPEGIVLYRENGATGEGK
ncbi:MAG: methyltransferase domain-containing protein [Anaerolineae bacterium]